MGFRECNMEDYMLVTLHTLTDKVYVNVIDIRRFIS